jgi:hypothetical protein
MLQLVSARTEACFITRPADILAMRAGIMTLGDAFAECLRYLCGLGGRPIRHHHHEAAKLTE